MRMEYSKMRCLVPSNEAASFRRLISARRGCCHEPGGVGAGGGACFDGVETGAGDAILTNVDGSVVERSDVYKLWVSKDNL
jgi:hypothetical protein